MVKRIKIKSHFWDFIFRQNAQKALDGSLADVTLGQRAVFGLTPYYSIFSGGLSIGNLHKVFPGILDNLYNE